jgi:hypothetical protein
MKQNLRLQCLALFQGKLWRFVVATICNRDDRELKKKHIALCSLHIVVNASVAKKIYFDY